MRLNTRKALNAASLAQFAAFTNDTEETITVSLPDDLTTLSTAELDELLANAKAAFAELNAAEDLSADQEALLEKLVEAKLALDTEVANRLAAQEARKAKLAAAAATFADAPSAEAAAEEAAPEAALAAEEVVAPKAPIGTISVPRLKARQTEAAAEVPVVAAAVSPIKAALGLSEFEGGSPMSMDQLADAFAGMTESARPGPVLAAKRSSARFSQKHVIAHIEKPFDKRAIVGKDGDANAAIAFATDQANIKSAKGASLTAAGGWCAPSEILYDMCKLESTDGLLSIPEIQVNRGGLRWTLGPDWVDIFANTGFCFTEADDQASSYSLTNEVQTATEGGAGLTSFTLTFDAQTTAAIVEPSTAVTVQAALEALSNINVGDIAVTGGGQPFVYTITFLSGGQYGGTNVSQITSTPTGGTGTVTMATTVAGGAAGGPKPTDIVPCPAFEENRLDVCGLTIQAGILLNRAYPEVVARYVSGALTAHAHRIATNVLAEMIAGSTAVTPTNVAADTAAISKVLSAIELQAEDMKYRYRMPRGTVLEAIFPFWARGVIRADLSRRQGVDMMNVTDAMIDKWFRDRGINPQFIYNFDNLGTLAGGAVVWPTTLRFLIYPAGTWVKGASPIITLSMLHDSTLNERNNFTAIFTEEAWMVMKMCHMSRIVSVPVCPTGATAAGVTFAC